VKICDHTSVGVLIWRNEELLLIERKKPPFGFAPPAGHLDSHGTYENAAKIEVREEVGLCLVCLELLTEGKRNNPCRRSNGNWHYWKVYQGNAVGNVKPSGDETKGFIWANKQLLKNLAERSSLYIAGGVSDLDWQRTPGIEPVWLDWFKELRIL